MIVYFFIVEAGVVVVMDQQWKAFLLLDSFWADKTQNFILAENEGMDSLFHCEK